MQIYNRSLTEQEAKDYREAQRWFDFSRSQEWKALQQLLADHAAEAYNYVVNNQSSNSRTHMVHALRLQQCRAIIKSIEDHVNTWVAERERLIALLSEAPVEEGEEVNE